LQQPFDSFQSKILNVQPQVQIQDPDKQQSAKSGVAVFSSESKIVCFPYNSLVGDRHAMGMPGIDVSIYSSAGAFSLLCQVWCQSRMHDARNDCAFFVIKYLLARKACWIWHWK